MINPQDQLVKFNSSAFETLYHFAQISLEGAERLVKLQLDAARVAVEENTKNVGAIAKAKDPQEAVAVRSKVAADATDAVLGYARSVYEITSQTQAELTKLIEDRMGQANRLLVTSVEEAAKAAPGGSDFGMNLLKNTLSASTAALDSLNKASKQVAEFTDASMKAATTATVDAVKAASTKK